MTLLEPKVVDGMDTWYCLPCDTSLRCRDGVDVRCKKRHKMRKANTEREFAMLQGAEGIPFAPPTGRNKK